MDVHRALAVHASAHGAIDARQVASDQVLQEHCLLRGSGGLVSRVICKVTRAISLYNPH